MKAFETLKGNIFVKGYNKAGIFSKTYKLLKITSTDEFDFVLYKYKKNEFNVNNNKLIQKELRKKYSVKSILIDTYSIEPSADFRNNVSFLNSFGEVDYKLLKVEKKCYTDNSEDWFITLNGVRCGYGMECDAIECIEKMGLELILDDEVLDPKYFLC